MQRLSLRFQLLIGMGILLILSVGGIGFLNYSVALSSLKKSLESQMDSIADISYNFIEEEAKTVSSHYLQGIAMVASQMVRENIILVNRRKLKEVDAQISLRRALLSFSIGKSGYLAILDGKGSVVFHPKLPPGTNFSSFDFIQEVLHKKEGVVFYSWRNPGETTARPKVLYTTYFPEKDWYLVATVYTEELSDIIDTSTFGKIFSSSGGLKDITTFLFTTKGEIVSHPTLPHGSNILSLTSSDGKAIFQQMIETGNGIIQYSIFDEKQNKNISYIAYYKKLASFPWVIVVQAPQSFLAQRTVQLRTVNFTIIFVAFLVMLIVVFFLSKSLQTSLKNIQSKLENLTSGTEKADLTRRIEIQARNEIGKIASLINNFLDKINHDLISVRQTSQTLQQATKQSQEIMEQRIKQTLESIKNKIIQIDYSTENATSGIEELTANLEEMSRSIQSIMNNMERQASAVEESASSIEEMVRNIENITATTIKSQTISNNLNNVAQEGGEAVKQAIASIKEVSEYSQQIMKMLQIISNIAKQTNLLAMNAAIEAAHAGEAGKGFAIVAEEIRRLSEDTNKNAREIGEVVNAILERITNSVKLSEKAGIGLDMIMAYSQQNVQIANQITIAMSEQNHGAKEILTSTHDMVKITEEVKLAITEQNTATQDFSDALRGLRDAAIENKQIIQEHLKDLANLLESVEAIQSILGQVSSFSNSLEALLGEFILSKTESSASTEQYEAQG